MTLDRLARLTLTATLLFGVAACAIVEEPRTPNTCGLVVSGGINDETLWPPYQTTMYRRSTGVEEANINLSGTGWGMTQIDFAGPGKSESGNVDMSGVAEGGIARSTWIATAPGTWHFQLDSGPCRQVFDVEVEPVP